MTIETHPLPPFLPENARLLLLGSFPPPRARWVMDFYYPNWQNDMWRIFGHIFFADPNHFVDVQHKTYREAAIRAYLHHQGIAISDTAHRAERLAGNAADKSLRILETTDLAKLLTALPHCTAIAATGELAARTLCAQLAPGTKPPAIGAPITLHHQHRALTLYRLPSSSRAYPLPLAQKARHYAQCFAALGMTES